MLELSNWDFKAAIIKMFQQASTDSLIANKNREKKLIWKKCINVKKKHKNYKAKPNNIRSQKLDNGFKNIVETIENKSI